MRGPNLADRVISLDAALVALMGAITMEEAYRAVEWRAVFLVAAILPVGMAIERTGGPTSLIFSRQGAPHMARSEDQIARISQRPAPARPICRSAISCCSPARSPYSHAYRRPEG